MRNQGRLFSKISSQKELRNKRPFLRRKLSKKVVGLNPNWIFSESPFGGKSVSIKKKNTKESRHLRRNYRHEKLRHNSPEFCISIANKTLMSYFPSQLLLARYAKSNGFTLRKTLHFDKSAIIKGGVFSGIKSVKKKKKGFKN